MSALQNGQGLNHSANQCAGRAPLLPDRHPKADFFICDVLDGIPKDDMASMEHPIFSLSTRPDRRILTYEHNDTKVEITPSIKGLATIHDKDVMIYCISQLIAKMNAGDEVSQTVHLKAYDLLVAPTGRPRAMAIGVCARPSSGSQARASSPISRPVGPRPPAVSV